MDGPSHKQGWFLPKSWHSSQYWAQGTLSSFFSSIGRGAVTIGFPYCITASCFKVDHKFKAVL